MDFGRIFRLTILLIWILLCIFMICGAAFWATPFDSDSSTNPSCFITTNKFKTTTPLLLKNINNTDLYIPSDEKGTIALKKNEIIYLSCPGSHVTVNKGDFIEEWIIKTQLKCVKDTKFEFTNKETFDFDLIQCSRIPQPELIVGKNCADATNETLINFKIDETQTLTQITICFDAKEHRVFYTDYELLANINGSQNNVENPNVILDDFFTFDDTTKIDDLYKIPNQKLVINTALGLKPDDETYVSSNVTMKKYLIPAQLAPMHDFVYGSQQLATFYYVNTAPLWVKIYEGSWSSLEKHITSYIGLKGLNLKVISGTHGTSEYTVKKDETEQIVPLYLHKDVPIPKIFWKIVYEPISQEGVAFVVVNNPNFEEKNICTDICKDIPWVQEWVQEWQKDIKTGYLYCCEFIDFKKENKINTPDLNVTSILK